MHSPAISVLASVSSKITLSEHELTTLFFALTLLLAAAFAFGHLFVLLKMPRVIGEIFGGLLLGPTFFGHFWPQQFEAVFAGFPTEGQVLGTIYNLGLLLLMFVSGLELKEAVNRKDSKLILLLFVGGTIIPFAAGWLATDLVDFSSFLGPKQNMFALKVVIGIAVAVTSIPVISKIFMELNVIHTRFAKIVVGTAAIEDVLMFVFLAIVMGAIGAAAPSAGQIVSHVAITLGFLGVGLLVLPKVVGALNESKANVWFRSSISGYCLLLCFLLAATANLLHVHLVFGALIAGMVIGLMPHGTFAPAKSHIRDIATGLFVPIYFAIIGLKLDLIKDLALFPLVAFLLFATVIKTIAIMVSARAGRQDWYTSLNFATAMNARGGPGIVLASIAFDSGIINEQFFVILVIVAVVTSLLAGVWFRFILTRGWELITGEPVTANPERGPSMLMGAFVPPAAQEKGAVITAAGAEPNPKTAGQEQEQQEK
jgi:Kef-type K+ transport system membrane component KefB